MLPHWESAIQLDSEVIRSKENRGISKSAYDCNLTDPFEMMAIKRFIHDPVALIDGACKALLSLHPGLAFDVQEKVVFRPLPPGEKRVTVLSGGGSGHEPAHAAYVGEGMLDAAVCGAIFASPNVNQIAAGLRSIQSPRGTLVIVKNYTGDNLNFGLAVERSRALADNTIRILMVDDDVSVGRTKGRMVGRRGLAGTVLIHKIAGAASTLGVCLDDVFEISNYAKGCLATIGVALNGCHVPGQQQHIHLGADEIELGMGIHNEPGSRKINPQPSTESLIGEMLAAILDVTDEERNYLEISPVDHPSDVVVLINNLGGLSSLEITCLTSMAVDQLKEKYSILPTRVYSGTFLSALYGAGFSITLLSLPTANSTEKEKAKRILAYLDAPTSAPGWSPSISTESWSVASKMTTIKAAEKATGEQAEIKNIPCDGQLMRSILTSIKDSLVKAEPQITEFDTLMGDGDCGTTLVAGATTITEAMPTTELESLSYATISISELISKGMGGTSGALYAIFFTSFAASVQTLDLSTPVSFPVIAEIAALALKTLQQYTKANVGDRTMMDALIPFICSLRQGAQERLNTVEALRNAKSAAEQGSEATRNMISVFGRSTYVGAGDTREDETKGIPDPGAMGIVAIAQGILNAVQAESEQRRLV